MLSQKARRRPAGEEDDDENDAEHEGEEREEKKSKKEAREVHLIARKTDGTLSASGISDMRREMLRTLAAEEAEAWVPIRYSDEEASTKLLDQLVTPTDTVLRCTSTMASIL